MKKNPFYFHAEREVFPSCVIKPSIPMNQFFVRLPESLRQNDARTLLAKGKNRLPTLWAPMKILTMGIFFLFLLVPRLWGQTNPSGATLQKLMSYPGVNFGKQGEREVVKASLQVTLQLVLEFNSLLRSAQLGEQIALSALQAAENRNSLMVNNSLTEKVERKDEKGLTDLPPETYNRNTTQTFSSTWTKQWGYGIRYSATFSQSNIKTDFRSNSRARRLLRNRDDSENKFTSSSVTVGMAVPLFQDWGDVNDLPVLKTQLMVDNSKIGTEQTRLQVLETFAQIYWDLTGLWKNQEVFSASVALSEQLVAENRVRAQAGVLNVVDLRQSEIQLSRSRQQLLEIENRIRDVEDVVKVALDLTDLPYGLFPSDAPQVRPVNFQFEEQLQKVLQHSLELKTLNTQIKNNGYDLEDAYNQDSPNIDLNLSYTQKEDKESPQSFGELGNAKTEGYQVGLTWLFSWPSDKTSEVIKQKKLEQMQLEIQAVNLKDTLKNQLRTIERNLKFAQKNTENFRAIRELAEETLAQELEKQQTGQRTAFHVSQAQQELLAAQSMEIQSLIDYEKTHLSLLILTGDIYAHYELPRQP